MGNTPWQESTVFEGVQLESMGGSCCDGSKGDDDDGRATAMRMGDDRRPTAIAKAS